MRAMILDKLDFSLYQKAFMNACKFVLLWPCGSKISNNDQFTFLVNKTSK
jgi:hypothetical protein